MTPQLITGNNFQKEVLEHDGIVFVDFYADWCGPCKMTEPVIEELAESEKYKNNVKFVKIDVDADQELASQFNVFSIPTFVTFVKGEIKGQFSGARDKTSFESEIDRATQG